MTDHAFTTSPDPAEIARALEIDGQYVAHVAPQRAEVIAVRRAAREASGLLGRKVRVTSGLPGETRPGQVTVVVRQLRLEPADEDRLRARAGTLEQELNRRGRRLR